MTALETLFKHYAEAPSDINEHLPLLADLASRCDHVTEMGMRGAVSTTALLFGLSQRAEALYASQKVLPTQTLVSWDINPLAVVSQTVLDLVGFARVASVDFQPRVGNTLDIIIEPTDMLFIDTLHTARQLKRELERHGDPIERKVRKYIAFHDTETFGLRGEDGSEPGLRAAIQWFQKNTLPMWGVKYDHGNCNGLVVLERADVSPAPGINPDPGFPRFK
jgi:hypothetical protein